VLAHSVSQVSSPLWALGRGQPGCPLWRDGLSSQAPPLRTLQDKTKQVTRVQTADGGFTVTYDQPLSLCVSLYPHALARSLWCKWSTPEVGTQAYAPTVVSVMRFSCGPGRC
jgi:hypothetical protein